MSLNSKLLTFILLAFSSISSYASNYLHDFESDGCSVVADGTIFEPNKWRNCCVKHDIHYWMGGTRWEKQIADDEFQLCMEDEGSPGWAVIYYLGVRANGHPGTGFSFQWGFGWEVNRGYQALSKEERESAMARLPKDPFSF